LFIRLLDFISLFSLFGLSWPHCPSCSQKVLTELLLVGEVQETVAQGGNGNSVLAEKQGRRNALRLQNAAECCSAADVIGTCFL
jgi:hypothetical protein